MLIRNQMKKFLSVFFLGVLALGSWAGAQTNSLTTDLGGTGIKGKRYSGSVGLAHSTGFVDDARPSSLVDFLVRYKYSKRHSVMWRQWAVKSYNINPGDTELSFLDPWVRYYYNVPYSPLSMNLSLRAQVTLPMSVFSRDNGIVSRPELRAYLGKGFFNNKLNLTLSPYFNYQINRFKTTKATPESAAGSPLMEYRYGGLAQLSYSPVAAWSIYIQGLWERVHFEESRLVNATTTIGRVNPDRHRYFFSVGTNYQVDKRWNVGVSTAQLSFAEQAGRAEVFAFDPYTTELSFETSYSF